MTGEEFPRYGLQWTGANFVRLINDLARPGGKPFAIGGKEAAETPLAVCVPYQTFILMNEALTVAEAVDDAEITVRRLEESGSNTVCDTTELAALVAEKQGINVKELLTDPSASDGASPESA